MNLAKVEIAPAIMDFVVWGFRRCGVLKDSQPQAPVHRQVSRQLQNLNGYF